MKRDPTPKKKIYKKPDSITDRNVGYKKQSTAKSGNLQMWGYSLYEGKEENGFCQIKIKEPVVEIVPSESFCYYLTNDGKTYYTGETTEQKEKVVDRKPKLFNLASKINIKKLFTGSDFTFALNDKKEVYCWGVNFMGQLGLNHNDFVSAPVKNDNFNFKPNNNLIPAMQNGLMGVDEKIKDIACGACHTIVLTSNNRVLTTGHGLNYALGHNNSGSTNYFKEVKYFIENKLKVSQIDAGLSHSVCLVRGKMFIWGTIGASRYSVYKSPTSISIDNSIKDFKLGDNLIVALTSKGEVYTMGDDKLGQLGVNGTNDYLPNKIKLPYKAEYLICGNSHVIVVTTAKIYGWGSNIFGQLNPNSIEKEINNPIELDWIADAAPTIVKCKGNQTFVYSKNPVTLPAVTSSGDQELTELKKIISNLKKAYNNSKKENEHLKEDFKKLHNTISEIDSYDKHSHRSDKNEDPVVKSKLTSDEQI